jgi:hypothetical protein
VAYATPTATSTPAAAASVYHLRDGLIGFDGLGGFNGLGDLGGGGGGAAMTAPTGARQFGQKFPSAGTAWPHFAQRMASTGAAVTASTGARQFGQKFPSAGTAWPQLRQQITSVWSGVAICGAS